MAISFPASGTYVLTWSGSAWVPSGTTYSVCFWVYCVSTAGYKVLWQNAATTNPTYEELYLANYSGMIQTGLDVDWNNGGSASEGTTALSNNAWTHCAFVRSGNSRIFYANGAVAESVSIAGRTPANTAVNIGAEDAAGSNVAYLHRFAYYKGWNNVALTAEQVKAEMRRVLPVTPGCVWVVPLWGPTSNEMKDLAPGLRPFSPTGSLTKSDPPGVSWGAAPHYYGQPGGAGPPVEYVGGQSWSSIARAGRF